MLQIIKSPFKIFLLFSSCFVLLYCNSREKKVAKQKEKPKVEDSFTQVNILFAGDVMMHLPQITAAKTAGENAYDFNTVFEKIAPIIKKADIAIANLETTFGGEPYTGYPQFSAPDTLAWFIKNAGFDVLVTANNHSADRGRKGILGAINGVKKHGLLQTGTFKNEDDRTLNYPLIIEKNNIKIALLNATYGTNGLPVPTPLLVNRIDTAEIRKDIKKAREKGAEIVLMMFHWGIEYENNPNKEQKSIAQWCLINGIDAVIGSHPHVIQPAIWETFVPKNDSVSRKGLVVYSLGNFISNQRDRFRDGGMMFEFTVRKNIFSKAIEIQNAGFYPSWVYIQPTPKNYYILPAAEYETDTTFINPVAAKEQMLRFLNDTRTHLSTQENVSEKK
ncbi:MAG: CapA family protein [Sphingobacteriales bacterium]|nr:MAG: CapA family protein [Sphingobacteriales bacterium]